MISPFISTHPLQKSIHPQLIRLTFVSWTHAHTLKLANFGSKDLDSRIILVHDRGELNKGLDVVRDCVWLLSIRIDESVRFITYGPEFNRMYLYVLEPLQGLPLQTHGAIGVAHEVDPLTSQVRPLFQGRGLTISINGAGDTGLNHTICSYGVEQLAEIIKLVI